MRGEILIVPRNEKYVREGVTRIQVPYSIIDDFMKPKEKPDKENNLLNQYLGGRLN